MIRVKSVKKKILIILLILFTAPRIYAQGLSSLSELAEFGENQSEAQKALNEETIRFEKVRRAIETGLIKKGQPQKSIAKRYGRPVIIIGDKNYPEKWVYKAGDASWFEGVKIYLLFDGDKKISGVKIINSSGR